MLRRGWPVVLVTTLACLCLAWAYLQFAAKQYQATSVLFVSIDDPQSVADLQQGSLFAVNAATTYAQIIDSATVLGPVSEQLRPQVDLDDLGVMVAVGTRQGTSLIDVAVSGTDPQQVAAVANATATSAEKVLPTLSAGPDGSSFVRVRQIMPAVEPSVAVSPDPRRVLAIGALVGLAIGLALTITVQSLDTRIRRVQDLRPLTSAPLLGAVPPLRRSQRLGVSTRDSSDPALLESFRTLRTNLRFLDANRRSFVVASAADHADGAHVPVNLAWMLSEAGYRVAVVDLDLRGSTVGDAFGIRPGPGIADVLRGADNLADVVVAARTSRLDVLRSGTRPNSPSELLRVQALSDILRRLESTYDYVIVHVPPLLSYTDAAVAASVAGGALVTVSTGRTSAQELSAALTVLANVGVTPSGVVLTRVGPGVLDHGGTRTGRLLDRLMAGRHTGAGDALDGPAGSSTRSESSPPAVGTGRHSVGTP